DLDVVHPAGEAAGRRVGHHRFDLAPGPATIVGQLHHLLAVVLAPGAAHAQRNAGGRSAAVDGHAAVAGGVVAGEQGPVGAVELVQAAGADVTGAGALGERDIEHAVGGAHHVGNVVA